jgi:corrinoid protein of di/trimethylamine methyltransferase
MPRPRPERSLDQEAIVSTLDEISSFLQKGRANDTKTAVQRAIDEGLAPSSILESGLMAGMDVIGQKFKLGEIYVPEVLVAAKAMKAGIEVLRPLLVDAGISSRGCVVIGTVKGDLHDIGKNLVRMMMEGKGLTVLDLGVDVSRERFAAAAGEHRADLVCCSALITTTMGEMRGVVEAIEAAGLRGKVKVMVGGAPVTDAFRESIGADLYAPDAASAAEAALAAIGG